MSCLHKHTERWLQTPLRRLWSKWTSSKGNVNANIQKHTFILGELNPPKSNKLGLKQFQIQNSRHSSGQAKSKEGSKYCRRIVSQSWSKSKSQDFKSRVKAYWVWVDGCCCQWRGLSSLLFLNRSNPGMCCSFGRAASSTRKKLNKSDLYGRYARRKHLLYRK